MNRDDRAAWAWCRTLADLGEMTARWLEGSVRGQPAYGYPDPGWPDGPDEETAALVPVLAAANRAGYLTSGSQPGLDSGGWQQRAAVDGFASGPDAELLIALGSRHGVGVLTAVAPRWRTRWRGAVWVTRSAAGACTRFGTVLSRRHLADAHVGYGECHPDAVRAVQDACQVTLIDMEWGRAASPLWDLLAEFAWGAR